MIARVACGLGIGAASLPEPEHSTDYSRALSPFSVYRFSDFTLEISQQRSVHSQRTFTRILCTVAPHSVPPTGPRPMGCGSSLPKVEGFLVDQPTPAANGYILGELASTAAGNVTLRYSGGISNRDMSWRRSNEQSCRANNSLLHTLGRLQPLVFHVSLHHKILFRVTRNTRSLCGGTSGPAPRPP